MTVNQISIFIENRKNALSELTNVIAEHKISLHSISIADTNDFGIARIIVDNSMQVQATLERSHYIVKTTPVIAVEIPDEPGSLNKILKVMAENGCNVEYMYGFTGHKNNCAYMIIRSSDIPGTEAVFEKNGIHMATEKELLEN
ncbi:MAG: amino acid-binding protein [Treponemataceae bacterium]|nr:amino acid-binding protein [Treponemataceae bacterium]